MGSEHPLAVDARLLVGTTSHPDESLRRWDPAAGLTGGEIVRSAGRADARPYRFWLRAARTDFG